MKQVQREIIASCTELKFSSKYNNRDKRNIFSHKTENIAYNNNAYIKITLSIITYILYMILYIVYDIYKIYN